MFKSYTDVRDWLENFIPQTYTKKELGLERIRYLLKLLGNPQDKFKSIHIAGTSGKGSTAFYTVRLLQVSKVPKVRKVRDVREDSILNTFSTFRTSNTSRTFKVGLHLSPHLVDIRERMMISSSSVIPASSQTRQAKLDLANAGIQKSSDSWIPNQVGNDNTLMSIGRFLRLFNEVGSIVEKIKKENPDLTPSYFEILVAASFLYFAQEKVDWAVVEVGLGGRLDATNVLEPELAVITNVGLDHTDILGKTIEEIAREKAGIIKKSVPVVTGCPSTHSVRSGSSTLRFNSGSSTSGKALEVIKKVAKEKKAPLITFNTQTGVQPLKSDINSYLTLYNDILKSSHVFFTKDVFFLSVFSLLSLGIKLTRTQIIEAFSVSFPARFEEIAKNVVIDGAHNVEKIKVLVDFVTKSFFARHSRGSGNLDPRIREDDIDGVVLVVAFKKGKDWKKMLEYLFKNLDIERVIATQFYAVTDTGLFGAVNPREIKSYLESHLRQGFGGQAKSKRVKIKVESFDNSQEAVFRALNLDTSPLAPNHLILVTGSLYLAGEARTLWHLPFFT